MLFFFLQPVLIGEAGHSLSSLLQKKQLSQTVVLPVQNVKRDGEFPEVGPLKVINGLTLRINYHHTVF